MGYLIGEGTSWHNSLIAGLWSWSKFKLQLCYYIHFCTNTLGKSMNLLIPSFSYELDSIIAVFLQG